MLSTQITRDSVTFTHLVNTFDTRARPLQVVRSSSLGNSRTETTAYSDNLSKWVLGQVSKVTCTAATPSTSCVGALVSETSYDATSALPLQAKSFGKTQATYSWNADGTLKTVTDGNGKVTTYGSWKRGIPQSIVHPVASGAAAENESAQVNDLGEIDWMKDENGYQTGYAYDAMGRLSQITYPTASPAWTSTLLDFSPQAAQYGLPINHWRQLVRTGNGYQVTHYDALWRPVVEERYDNGNAANTRSIVVKRYDAAGRLAFQSYPVRALDTYLNATLKGVRTEYDALDRVTAVKQDAEGGMVLNTTTQYLAGFKTKVVQPGQQASGIGTTTSYLAWDQPTTDYPVAITHPEGAFTDIVRDAFGKPTAIVRRNADSTIKATRSYLYGGAERLCMVTEPETGSTVVWYDEVGNLINSAAGLTIPAGTSCPDAKALAAASGRSVIRTYDPRNRVKSLLFPDHRGDTIYDYTLDGLLATIDTSDAGATHVITNYQYNTRRQPISEQLQMAGFNWLFKTTYNTNGHASSHVYPDNVVVDYAPNALGQPTKAGTYATGVSYHPNGGMAGFTYGNGLVHTMTQNTRQLPEQSIDSGGVLNDSYDYDANGNVAAISDGLAGARGNRDMTYDNLDRLKTASSKLFATTGTGTASYGYDVLDNLRTVSMPATATTPTRNYAYCYDGTFRLAFLRTASCAGAAAVTLGYDAQGNLANKNNQDYVFDQGNRLRAMQPTTATVPVETYAYDGHGRRVMAAHATLGVIWSQYSQDGALRYQRNERTAKATDYVSLNSSLVARVSEGVAPGTPALSVPAYAASGSYTVSWTAMTTATSYTLQEKAGTGSWGTVQTSSAVSRAVTGKTPGTTYTYRVQACNTIGCGGWSNEGAVSVAALPTGVPVLTVPASSTGAYTASWTTVAGAESYTLEESANGGTWTVAYTGTGTSKAYSGKAAGSYGYRIKACNTAGCTASSATKTVVVTLPPTATPTLTVPATNTTGSYTVSWTAVATATSYQLEEGIGSSWTQIQATSAISKALSGKAAGSYGYRVKACNSAGCGPVTAAKTVVVTLPPTAAPTLTTPATNATGAWTVSWTAVAAATSYRLEERIGTGAWTEIQNATTRTKAISGKGNGSYGYRARGCNAAGCGPYAAIVTTTVQLIPAVPVLTGYVDRDMYPVVEFLISWTDTSGASSYQLQQKRGSGTPQIIYTGTSLNFSTMESQKTSHTYWIRACNGDSCSAWSSPLQLWTE